MSECRSHTALVRLTETEWASWEAAARAAGYGRTATWVRSVIADAITADAGASSTDEGAARAVAAQVARVGSNLNQIARALNVAERGGPDVATAHVAEVLEAVRGELRAIRAMDFADGALGAEGHQVADPVLRDVLWRFARGELSIEEALAAGRERVESGQAVSAPSLDAPYEAATPEQTAQWLAQVPAEVRAKRPGMFEDPAS